MSEKTLLQQTALRFSDPGSFEPLIVIGSAQHACAVLEQLGGIGANLGTLVLEPFARSTAAAAAVAAALVSRTAEDALILLTPADHHITDVDQFLGHIAQAIPAANAGSLVLFGIKPQGPATSYGYIKVGERSHEAERAYKVDQFVEKPNQEKAEEYLRSRDYLWNSGIFLFSARSFLSELARYDPEILYWSTQAVENGSRQGKVLGLASDDFQQCPSNSIDCAVMERTDRAVVIAADFPWTDVGSWSALWELANRDRDGNALIGNVLAESTRGSYIRSEGPLVATLGVDGLIVVATDDVVLVANRGSDQDIKGIVQILRGSGLP